MANTKISRDEVLDLTIKGLNKKGLNKAQNKYLEWTRDGEGVSNGAEYVLTTYIAESIGSSQKIGTLYVEEPIKTLFESCDKENDDIIDSCRGDGRADIAIYLKNQRPLAIIEVKNNVNKMKKVDLDLERINCLIDQDIIEYGVVAFISEFEKKDLKQEDVENQTSELLKIDNDNNEFIKSNNLKYEYLTNMFEPSKSYGDKYWSWSSIAILFYK